MRYFVLTIVLILSASALAGDKTPQDYGNNLKKHLLGGGYGIGLATGENTGGLGLGSLFYEYRLNETISLNAKYYWGQSKGFEREDNFESRGLQLTFKGQANLIGGLNGYGRLGTNIYDSETGFQSDIKASKGIGFVAATGLEYNADNGFVVGLEVEYLTAGRFNLIGSNLLVAYSF